MPQPTLNIKTGTVTTQNRESFMKDQDRRMAIYDIMPIKAFAMTAFMDRLGDQVTRTRKYSWTNQPHNNLEETVIDVYTKADLATAYASGAVDGDTLYLKVSDSASKNPILGDIIQITATHASGYKIGDIDAIVTNIATRGATDSYIAITLMEADSASLLAQAALKMTIITRAEDEISQLPASQYEEPTEYENVVQHIMASAAISDLEAAEVEQYGGDIENRLKLQALYRLNQKREGMRIFGTYKGTGSTLRSRGLRQFIETYAPENIINWRTDTAYSTGAETWLQGFLPFTRRVSEYGSRYSQEGSTKVLFTSSYVINAISDAVLDLGDYHIDDATSQYGALPIKLLRGLNQNWELVEHPRFSTSDSYRYSGLLTEIPLLQTRTMAGLGMRFIPWSELAQRYGEQYVSAKKCGWEVYEGFQVDNVQAHFWLDNLTFDQANA